jgi:D-inositol-3-phosphate glycosyltransferase
VTSGPLSAALLTGGSDKPYALGLASALARQGVAIEFVGSDELDCPQVHAIAGLRFLNLRGDQREDVSLSAKLIRVAKYYGRLASYVATTKTRILHILWNNKFEVFDRTILMAYYRLLSKRVVLTAHNVNAAARDGRDSWLNRMSLRIQYRLSHHVFVHTEQMKRDLASYYGVASQKISVIPFGINNTVPTTDLAPEQAKLRLGLARTDRTLLFFGRIAPYKGLEYLIAAVAILARTADAVRLIIGGRVERGHGEYWRIIQQTIAHEGIGHLVVQRIAFIPDEEVEQYFKAADVVVLPYVRIFQSGVPFLAFSFGVPVIATDVGALREDVVAETGLLCRPADSLDLARTITRFFESDLSCDADAQRERIRRFAAEKHSWATVGERTKEVYAGLLSGGRPSSAATRADVGRGA